MLFLLDVESVMELENVEVDIMEFLYHVQDVIQDKDIARNVMGLEQIIEKELLVKNVQVAKKVITKVVVVQIKNDCLRNKN